MLRGCVHAGTSSKSTKLVHGGVRYLQKAVFELDYEQCVVLPAHPRPRLTARLRTGTSS